MLSVFTAKKQSFEDTILKQNIGFEIENTLGPGDAFGESAL